MTARRAAPEPPTRLQRLTARLTSAARHEALVSALEDHADRLEHLSRRAGGPRSTIGIQYAETAAELRRIIKEQP